MKLGIQLSSIRAYMQSAADMERSLVRLAEIGFRTVQLQWHNMEIPAETVSALLRSCDMHAVSVQDYTASVLADPEAYLALADACGFDEICISGIPAEDMSADGICRFAERIRPFAARLADGGKKLSFHPRYQELAEVDGKCALFRLTDELPEMRVLPDTNHILRAGLDPDVFFRAIAGNADWLHCKDMTDRTREKSHLTPVGQGCTDWKTLLPAAEAAGVRVAFVEQEAWDCDAFDAMRISAEYLRALGLAF